MKKIILKIILVSRKDMPDICQQLLPPSPAPELSQSSTSFFKNYFNTLVKPVGK